MKPDYKNILRYGVPMRLAEISDAAFILKLRNNPGINKYISATSNNLQDQINWLSQYKERELLALEYYFIATAPGGAPVGTTRLYNFEEDTFETGSWIFEKTAPTGWAVKADIIGREIGYYDLGFNYCKFKVSKNNRSVVKYHLRYKPELIFEDEEEYHFLLGKPTFERYRDRLLKIL